MQLVTQESTNGKRLKEGQRHEHCIGHSEAFSATSDHSWGALSCEP